MQVLSEAPRPGAPTEPPARRLPPPVTLALMGANLGVFAAQYASGADPLSPTNEMLLRWGANSGPAVGAGEWWRLLSGTFLHGGLLHLALNMWVLSRIGPPLEALFGTRAFACIYLLGGVFASCASILAQPTALSVGASGSICALFGAQLGFLYALRQRLPQAAKQDVRRSLLLVVGLNVAMAMAIPNIDHAAHLGGLVAGFVLLLVELRRALRTRSAFGVGAHMPALALALLALTCVLLRWRVEHSPAVVAQREFDAGIQAQRAGELERACVHYEAVLVHFPEDMAATYNLARIEFELGEHEQARARARQLLESFPEDPDVQALARGLGLVEQGALAPSSSE